MEKNPIRPCWSEKLRAAARRNVVLNPQDQNQIECEAEQWAFCAAGECLYGAAGDPARIDVDELPADEQIQRAIEKISPSIARRGGTFTYAIKHQNWPYAIEQLRGIQFLMDAKRRPILKQINEYVRTGQYRA